MLKYSMLVLGFYSSVVFCMNSKDRQLEFPISTRKAYVQSNVLQKPTESVCNFCDEKILATNHIIREDHESDVREMMNKFPYFDFDQGQHLLIMPRSHKEHPEEFSHDEIVEQADAVRNLSAKLYGNAYTQEYFTNWGKDAGQSVPHWHSHLKSYVKPPQSIPERIACYKDSRIKTIEEAYEELKTILESAKNTLPSLDSCYDENECTCCTIKNEHAHDEKNLVVGRFPYNYICLSHYPSLPGEIAVIPNRHVAAIKDLSREEFGENMVLAMALLSTMQKYAHEYIRGCSSANLCTKSMGEKAPGNEKSNFHLYTRILPRTIISLSAGQFADSSCKLDFDPVHLFAYLKDALSQKKI